MLMFNYLFLSETYERGQGTHALPLLAKFEKAGF